MGTPLSWSFTLLTVLASARRRRLAGQPRVGQLRIQADARGWCALIGSPALADGSVEFVYAFHVLLAIEGIPTSQYRLEALADEELGVTCPQCLGYLYLDLAGPDFRTTVADDGTATPTPIIPARPDDLSDGAARMHGLAARHRHTDVATGILYLVGDATCPACGTRFGVPHALAEERTRS
jgi:hypothetical protein